MDQRLTINILILFHIDASLISTECHFGSQVDLSVHPDAEECVKKEICVHKLLKHRNVVGCYGSRCPEMNLNLF